jgi:hypothetical protein
LFRGRGDGSKKWNPEAAARPKKDTGFYFIIKSRRWKIGGRGQADEEAWESWASRGDWFGTGAGLALVGTVRNSDCISNPERAVRGAAGHRTGSVVFGGSLVARGVFRGAFGRGLFGGRVPLGALGQTFQALFFLLSLALQLAASL